MVTASYDETARMWDMESTNLMGVFKGHTCCVTSASFRTNDKWVFCTGASDGNVLFWDWRCNHRDGYYRPVNSIRNAHTPRMPSTPRPNPQQDDDDDDDLMIMCVVYQDENTIVSAGSIDGTIKLWDMRKNYTAYQCTPIPKHSFQCPGERVQERGFSSLVVDSAGTRLFASCTHSNSISTDSAIYMYNCHSMETQPVATFTGHTCCSFHVRCALSPCEEYLLSGSSDASAYIWKVNDPEACPWKLTGHRKEVTAVAWCQDDFTKLITCSNDDTMRVWRHQPLTDKERDPDDVVGDVQRVVRTPQKSAGTWKPETFDSGVRTVGVGSPRMATTVSNKVPTANAASPKHAAGASPNAEAVATAGLPTPENEQS
ncbi:denticleless protein homolog [Branchiostoma floridae x Branchiostoma belcheri]